MAGPLSSEPVINLQAVSEQARAEKIQRKILAAQLAAQVLSSTSDPSEWYVKEICGVFDTFLTVE